MGRRSVGARRQVRVVANAASLGSIAVADAQP